MSLILSTHLLDRARFVYPVSQRTKYKVSKRTPCNQRLPFVRLISRVLGVAITSEFSRKQENGVLQSRWDPYSTQSSLSYSVFKRMVGFPPPPFLLLSFPVFDSAGTPEENDTNFKPIGLIKTNRCYILSRLNHIVTLFLYHFIVERKKKTAGRRL